MSFWSRQNSLYYRTGFSTSKKGCFARIYNFSPSTDVDSAWLPVKHYSEKKMQVQQTDEEPIYFDHYDSESLKEIINTKHNITQIMKNGGDKIMFQILTVIDDFADDPACTRQSKMLRTLCIISRHSMINTVTATLKFNAFASYY